MSRLGVGRADLIRLDGISDQIIVAGTLDRAFEAWLGNPGGFAAVVKPNAKVVLKPNFVNHRNYGPGGIRCLVTSKLLILEVLKRVAACSPREIILGDAPIQGCDWNQLVTEAMLADFRNAVGNIPFSVRDFRRTVYSAGSQLEDIIPESEFILFDLKKNSYLEAISEHSEKFRVTMYDHRKLNKRHSSGTHQYLVARDALDADVVISLPKLKTHKKAGITGALKNLVGICGNKEFLPHHRKGGTLSGGDCYPGRSLIKSTIENLDESMYTHRSKFLRRMNTFIIRVLNRLDPRKGGEQGVEGSWFGNDTVWRTAMDLNRILYFGTVDGIIMPTEQRTVISITDAIICGQGEGPLSPDPLPVGVITVTDRPDVADHYHALLLGMEPEHIPLVANAPSLFDGISPEEATVSDEGIESSLSECGIQAVKAVLPRGWTRYLG